MNSFVITVFVAVLAFGSALPIDKESMKEAAKNLLKTCKTKTGASDADLQALADHKLPQTREGLCMIECVFDTTKLMQKGKFSRSGLIEGFKSLTYGAVDTTKLKKIEQLAETCDKEVGEGGKDKCETAKLLVDCIVKNASANGINISTR